MSDFVSRKQLEVHGDTYPVRQQLKELGCEWDAAARAWIAPTLEVKELCDEIVDNQIRGGHWLKDDFDYNGAQFEELMAQFEGNSQPVPEVELAAPIAYEPTKDDAQRICGAGNVLRYWRDDIPDVAAELLASGEQNWQAIYGRLDDAGWRNRSVSVVREIVEHYRQHPPIPAIDEVITMPAVITTEAVNPEDMDGSISVLADAEKNPVAFKVQFPYSAEKVNMVKWLPGRKWRSDRKFWEVPLDSRHGSKSVFEMFPHFKRSPRAAEIEAQQGNQ